MPAVLEVRREGLRQENRALIPPFKLEEKRQICWERPFDLKKRPCGAVLTVGSFPTRDVHVSMRETFVGCSEGGVVGVGQFTNLPHNTDHPKYQSQHTDQMDFQTICFGKSKEVGVPSLVSVKGLGILVEDALIKDGEIHWTKEESKVKWEKLKTKLQSDYANARTNPESVKWEDYDVPEDAMPGFYQLLGDLDQIGKYNPWAIKLQFSSPANIAKSVTDNKPLGKDGDTRNPLSESAEFVENIQMMVALRNKRMVDQVREKWGGRIIVSTDNPSASDMTPQEISDDAEMAFSLLPQDVLKTEHSCGGKIEDFGFLKTWPLDGVHLDAWNFPATITANADAFADFLLSGESKFLAVGIVPTKALTDLATEIREGERIDQNNMYMRSGVEVSGADLMIKDASEAVMVVGANYFTALDILKGRLDYIVESLWNTGKFGEDEKSKRDLWSRIMVSSSCGQGSLEVGTAKMVSYLMRDLSYKVRADNIGVDYGLSEEVN
ncbi:MAG: hypothetical protein UT63_C0004G0013 [Candidatus Gottesmanbacteria bacterium GW2011_GWC2_39_8]|uniref:Uncharacterized protein n=1 Tax=Candidatus Gottesmanbacteria bacterium GW2011_GWC2_39_8 TaxID=1618450 RepID=A0A0G0QA75_9BACT|nr:MAG: hypothetical protein UT63_C0004G0013 [Candidatus Gottesmanbacteria bacterium GW2011_GWC2_39_8]